jgi:hypothetical protein
VAWPHGRRHIDWGLPVCACPGGQAGVATGLARGVSGEKPVGEKERRLATVVRTQSERVISSASPAAVGGGVVDSRGMACGAAYSRRRLHVRREVPGRPPPCSRGLQAGRSVSAALHGPRPLADPGGHGSVTAEATCSDFRVQTDHARHRTRTDAVARHGSVANSTGMQRRWRRHGPWRRALEHVDRRPRSSPTVSCPFFRTHVRARRFSSTARVRPTLHATRFFLRSSSRLSPTTQRRRGEFVVRPDRRARRGMPFVFHAWTYLEVGAWNSSDRATVCLPKKIIGSWRP